MHDEVSRLLSLRLLRSFIFVSLSKDVTEQRVRRAGFRFQNIVDLSNY